ncbi:hypothetical protein BRC97_10570, partial [Halobacteriales archaeon QS_6_71_20]
APPADAGGPVDSLAPFDAAAPPAPDGIPADASAATTAGAPADTTADATTDTSTHATADAPTNSPAAAPADALAGATTATADGDIHVTTRLALTPDRPGEVGVTLRFEVPDRVAELDATIAADARDVTAEGFSAAGDDTYEWDGDTATPTISFRLPANRTAEAGRFDRHAPASSAAGSHAGGTRAGDVDAAVDPAAGATNLTSRSATAAGDGYLFVDAGPWALVSVPGTGLSWRYRGEAVGVTRETTVDGSGAVGDRVAFLGEHTLRERTAHGQTFRLAIPERAAGAMTVSPEAVLDAYADASDRLRVGDRDGLVFVVAAPTGVEWAVRGLQTGDAGVWVRADEPLNTSESPWLHEYVHTRQSYETTAETRWTIEGSADYYAAALALRQERIGFEAFADHLARGTRDPHADAVLSEPGTWASGTQYRKGSLVTGELDRRIRLATGGGATYGTVLARLNAESEPVTGDRLRESVADAGNESVADAADRYARTDAAPPMWDADGHEAAFGTLAARIVVEPAAPAASGPYRTATLAPPATVAVGETVTVPATVANEGGAAGDYRVALTVDGRTVDAADGTLAPRTNTTVRPSWTADEPGTYELSVRGRTYELRVREPSAPRVASLSADRTTVEAGESVRLVVEFVAEGAGPADGEVTVRVDGEPVATERVRVAPNATATLRLPVAFNEPGRRTVSVGDRTLTVSVTEPPTASPSAVGTTSTRTPGLGAGAAAAALLVAVAALVGVGRRRSRG